MSWRTVVVTKQSKLSYKNGHLIIRNEDVTMIHLSEINTIIVDSTAVSITSYLICELLKEKIKLLFCDEKCNPIGEVIPYYGAHNTSKRILQQTQWKKENLEYIWTRIIYEKISNQSDVMKKFEIVGWEKLREYLQNLKMGDTTNREGHAAKVYFNALFGKSFSRDQDSDINAALNYGYSILLSNFNKEICANGYLTQLGMKHKNEFNPFNLTSDLMEPFRVLIDEIVYLHIDNAFNHEYRFDLIDVLNKKVRIDDKEQFLTNAIGIYLKSVFKAIETQDIKELKFFEYV